jgi:hypothetical protein
MAALNAVMTVKGRFSQDCIAIPHRMIMSLITRHTTRRWFDGSSEKIISVTTTGPLTQRRRCSTIGTP